MSEYSLRVEGAHQWLDRASEDSRAAPLDAPSQNFLLTAAPLSIHAVSMRYPGAPYEPAVEDADEAIIVAEAVLSAIYARVLRPTDHP